MATTTSNNAANIFTINVSISSAQILNLAAAPVLLITQPSGYLINLLSATVIFTNGNVDYVGSPSWGILFSQDSGVTALDPFFSVITTDGLINIGINSWSNVNYSATSYNYNSINGPINVYLFNAGGSDPTDGTGTANIIIDYKLIKAATYF